MTMPHLQRTMPGCRMPGPAPRSPRHALRGPAQASAGRAGAATATKVQLETTSQCELAVSIYPMFSYNAEGGGGAGIVEDAGDGRQRITFAAAGLNIPALNWRTARVLGLPIPPPLNIAIQPRRFEGVLDPLTGEVNMTFDAEFLFTIASLYAAPALQVSTTLTTESSSGRLRSAVGRRLSDGEARLVGVATVPKTGDAFLDTFLQLPTDALAIMEARLTFS